MDYEAAADEVVRQGLCAQTGTAGMNANGIAANMPERNALFYTHKYYLFSRRAQDIFFSLLALPVLSPLLLLTAIAIYVDDPHGSPIFRQTRCGKDGKPFRMYKFRSMYVDAEEQLEELLQYNEMDGPVFKIRDDRRITRVGRFIRRTGIDELPQLVNVLKGDMSIVGPRPPLPREVALYTERQRRRLCVRPGLTCYWQIQPDRNAISFDEWVELDLKYIAERSFPVDWKIIFKTVKAVISMQGE